MADAQAEITRLSNDIKGSDDLKNQVQHFGHDTDAFVKWANGHGYQFDLNDLNAYIADKTNQLLAQDKSQLDAASPTNVNQNVNVNGNQNVNTGVGATAVAVAVVVT